MNNEDKILNQLSELTKAVYNNSIRTKRVEKALMGDPTIGHNGLVKRLEIQEDKSHETDKKFEKQEIEKAKQKWFAMGVGAGSGGFFAWLTKYLVG